MNKSFWVFSFKKENSYVYTHRYWTTKGIKGTPMNAGKGDPFKIRKLYAVALKTIKNNKDYGANQWKN